MDSRPTIFNWCKFERCTEKHFEEDARDAIQKRTFTRWINSRLCANRNRATTTNDIIEPNNNPTLITDLYADLRDGHRLISLLESLTGDRLRRETRPLRLHHLQNVRNVLDYLHRSRAIQIVNIRPEEIVDGNAKLTLSLVWAIVETFVIPPKRETLLEWTRAVREGKNAIKDFTYSWRDGMLFRAIVRYYRDRFDDSVIWIDDDDQDDDQEEDEDGDRRKLLRQAFAEAEQRFGVARLLDPADVDCDSMDERSMLTYIATLYRRLASM